MENSYKRKNFARIAEKRTIRALEAIRVIGNLSNRSNYDFTEKDVIQIKIALNREVSNMARRFSDSNSDARAEFRLEG